MRRSEIFKGFLGLWFNYNKENQTAFALPPKILSSASRMTHINSARVAGGTVISILFFGSVWVCGHPKPWIKVIM